MIGRRMLRPALSLAVALAVVALAASCGGKADKTSVPEATPVTQPTPAPTATTAPAPTPTAEPTPTPEPTATPEPTVTPQPTAESVTLDELEIPDIVIEAGPLLGDLGGFGAGSVVIPTDLMGGLDLSGSAGGAP